jgi:PKD repeat protein
MKKINFTILLSFAFLFTIAQPGQWVWLQGSNVIGSAANYGTKGVPSATNTPAALYEACQWTDLNGSFWLFGGMDKNYNFNNNLWKYDPTTNMWTWMKGPGTLNNPGNFGTQGVPSATNNPAALGHGIAAWTDLQNNLWMFGGYDGFGSYSDLWRYNISTNMWTWMKGDQNFSNTGVWGTKGVPNSANIPGAKAECAANWVDNNGDLWLFGGQDGSSLGTTNDLWRYNIATNTFTWMKGSNFVDQLGVYGTLGVENVANTPGARGSYSHWIDKSGNFWLFGGMDITRKYNFNDLWRYNPTTGNWAWISGTNIPNDTGLYGTKCNPSPFNRPPARDENRACWMDQNENLWFFGGFYKDQSAGFVTNDLWMYSIANGIWTWESNDTLENPAANWGTIGVASPTNKPGGKGGSVSWMDNAGNFYLFGGTAQGFPNPYNDLWKYTPDPICSGTTVILPVAGLQSSDSTLCTYDCINFTDLSTNATSWKWTFQGALPPSSTDQNPQSVCYFTSGNFDVTLIASNNGGSDTLKATSMISVIDAPPTPIITRTGNTLSCSFDPSYISYQWYDSTTIVPGATDTFYVATHSGNYNVSVVNTNGCSIAVGINIIIDPLGVQQNSSDKGVYIYPNPTTGKITVLVFSPAYLETRIITVTNVLGEIICKSQIVNSRAEIDLSEFAAGMYFVDIKGESGRWSNKIIKQ